MPMKTVTLRVNGTDHELSIEPRRTLVDALRHDLDLTGAKKSCGMGNCGACTVTVDGEAVYACLALAIDCADREIRTVEGLASDGGLDRLQKAFVDEDALQCGYCTPGQLMSATALLARSPEPTEDEIRHALDGNLCRCGAYRNIVRAVQAASRR